MATKRTGDGKKNKISTKNEKKKKTSLLNDANKKSMGKKKNSYKTGKKKKTGRRTKATEWITKEGLTAIKQWKRDGLTDQEIADEIGISKSTFSDWKRKYKELAETLKHGRARADATVEDALFKSACGHYETIKRPVLVKGVPQLDADGNVMYYEEQIYIKPEPKSIIFYLTNRCHDKYRMNRKFEDEKKDDAAGNKKVEIVVRNDNLQELEREAIEKAKAADEAKKNGDN